MTKAKSIKRKLSVFLASALMVSVAPMALAGELTHLGSYSTGAANIDGGVAEIVAYNENNQNVYLVNGQDQEIQIVSVADIIAGDAVALKTINSADLTAMLDGFVVADITSVAVDVENNRIAVALQAESYNANGKILILDADGNYVADYICGVQPDMVKFSPNGQYVLSADEGEPRMGFVTVDGQIDYDATVAAGIEDPKGSVTIVNLDTDEVKTVDFTAFDEQREDLTAAGVIVKKGLMPSVDFEPEYITMSDDTFAYVVLQEANAIATLNIETGEFTAVNSLGFKDHNLEGNELDGNKRDEAVVIVNENLYGTYMPDGISSYVVDGVTYILTANEGDGSEWGEDTEFEYCNESEAAINATYVKDGEIKDVMIDVLNNELLDGLDADKNYSFGGRSFSIYKVDGDTLTQVFDSGSDFEKLTAEMEYFNTTNDENQIDDRSDNKGPEPENVTTLAIDGKVYAYIGLERQSGVMVYDVTDPENAFYVDYLNTRNFEAQPFEEVEDDIFVAYENMGDISPEGIVAVHASQSPNGENLVITGNEVSGTVAIYQHGGNVVAEEVVEEDDFETVEFADLADFAWAADAIAWAKDLGYVDGTSETTFDPAGFVTLEQVAMIVDSIYGTGISTNDGAYATRGEVIEALYVAAGNDLEATAAMALAQADGVIIGDENGDVNADSNVLRAELALILQRIMSK